jgi:hypothetical protein
MGRHVRNGLLLLAVLIAAPASGARFPDAVKKSINLTGEAAISAAHLLGLPTSEPNSRALPLSGNDTWAIYISEHGRDEHLKDSRELPPAETTFEFVREPAPMLTISPWWLDLTKRYPESDPGAFSLDSPLMTFGANADDPWMPILWLLSRQPEWHAEKQAAPHAPRYKRCFTDPRGTELCIAVLNMKDFSGVDWSFPYLVELTARPK